MAGPFKMKGSPMQRNFGIGKEKHFLEREATIPMETHKGGDPKYKPTLKSKTSKSKDSKAPTDNGRHIDAVGDLLKKEKSKSTQLTKGDVLQTLIFPEKNIKKTTKVVEHYRKKAIKGGKSLYGKVKKYLKSGV